MGRPAGMDSDYVFMGWYLDEAFQTPVDWSSTCLLYTSLSVGDDDYQCIQGSGLETLLPTSTLSRILQEDLEPDFADRCV